MININELQRGNLVLRDGEVKRVIGFFNEMGRNGGTVDFIQLDNLLDYLPDQIEPVILTEPMLRKKLGFKTKAWSSDFEYDILSSKMYLRKSFEGGFYWGMISHDTGYKNLCEFDAVKPFKYLHQLQNFISNITTGEQVLDVSKII